MQIRTSVVVQLLHDFANNLANRLHGLDVFLGLLIRLFKVLQRESHFLGREIDGIAVMPLKCLQFFRLSLLASCCLSFCFLVSISRLSKNRLLTSLYAFKTSFRRWSISCVDEEAMVV